MWLYQLIMRPKWCYKWNCFCASDQFIRELHLLILHRIGVLPVQENVEGFDRPDDKGVDTFDPFKVVPEEARVKVFNELVSGIKQLGPLLQEFDPDLDREPLKAFRRLIRIVHDYAGGYEKMMEFFEVGEVKNYLLEMHEHFEEGKRRYRRHIVYQKELEKAGKERRARDRLVNAERQRKRAALKIIRDRERAIFAGR